MRNSLPLIGILALAACSTVGQPTLRGERPLTRPLQACSSVGSVKSDFQRCMGRSIQIEAYLIPTDHGPYLVDSPAGSDVLLVYFSESKSERDPISDLKIKLIRSAFDPHGHIHGVFEGRLTIMPGKKNPVLAIDKQIK